MVTTLPYGPNWPEGYVPSPNEWQEMWQSKADFPVPINQGGTGAQSVQGANNNLAQRVLIPLNSAITLSPFTTYLVTTNGPNTAQITLPPLAKSQPADYYSLYDKDFQAWSNNVTISLSGSDTIFYRQKQYSSYTLTQSGFNIIFLRGESHWIMELVTPRNFMEIVNGNANLYDGGSFGVNASSGSITATLPDLTMSPNGSIIEIQDIYFKSGTNPINVNTTNGQSITYRDMAPMQSFPIQTNGITVKFINCENTWRATYSGN